MAEAEMNDSVLNVTLLVDEPQTYVQSKMNAHVGEIEMMQLSVQDVLEEYM